MGSNRFASQPWAACRPFDRERDGFIYGEGCGAVVVERAASALARGAKPYAGIKGWGVVMDANRNPNPAREGEVAAIRQALERAGLSPGQIDYVNPHGTGSPLGDETEVEALMASGLTHARINATKSIAGHGLSAAGTLEVVATLLQMKASVLHPTLNLDNPISDECNWVRGEAVAAHVNNALKISLGFGGINAAMCLQSWVN
jgi:malonyl-ACP decarboxylase